MRHTRSEESEQRRFIKRLVMQSAFQDRQRSETVNLLTPSQIAASAVSAFDYVLPELTSNFMRGEVLSDGRGNGTLQ